MKTIFIILFFLIACISCETNNKPVSDAQKEKIKGEVKEVVNTIIKGAEEANIDMVLGLFHDSPDFVALFNGSPFTYQQFLEMGKSMFGTLLNQKATIIDEKYIVLDNSTVLFTANSKWVMNFKDGHTVLEDPWAMQYLFKKIENEWKIVSFNESGVEQSIKSEEALNQLNQEELMKQFIGSWKLDIAEDTTIFIDIKSYGKGWEGIYRAVANGRAISEYKILLGYSEGKDKVIQCFIEKEQGHLELSAYYFISSNKYIQIPYSSISNPDNAKWKIEGEFKSSDMFVDKVIVNNKHQRTDTYVRIK